MEKIILVHYLNYNATKSRQRIREELGTYINFINDREKENIVNYVVPVTGETRIECINPKLVSQEEYSKALETLNTAKEQLAEFLSKQE